MMFCIGLTLFSLCIILHAFCRQPIFFQNQVFQNNTVRVSDSLDPDQAQQFVGPDLVPNCLQKLSVDDTRMQRVKNKNKTMWLFALQVAQVR